MFSSVIVWFLCVAWFSVPLLGSTSCPDDYQSQMSGYVNSFQAIASLHNDSLNSTLCGGPEPQ